VGPAAHNSMTVTRAICFTVTFLILVQVALPPFLRCYGRVHTATRVAPLGPANPFTVRFTGAVRAHKGIYHEALFAKGNTEHAGPHAAQPVGWARAGCRDPPVYPRPARVHARPHGVCWAPRTGRLRGLCRAIRRAPLGRRRHRRCVPVPPPPTRPPPAGRPRRPARRLAARQRRLGSLIKHRR
jgi:hypothetical protein